MNNKGAYAPLFLTVISVQYNYYSVEGLITCSLMAELWTLNPTILVRVEAGDPRPSAKFMDAWSSGLWL